MGFWRRIAKAANDYVSGEGDARSLDPMDPRFWGAPDTASLAGQRVSPASALQLDVVQSVLQRLAGTVSVLPMKVFERVADDGENGGRREATNHPLYRLLHARPNRRQTPQEFWGDLTEHLGFWRNAYAEIVPAADGFNAESLEPIHPERMLKIERRADRKVYYTVRRLDGTGQDVFAEDDIFHLRRPPLTADGLRGRYMFETAREVFGKAQAVEEFGALYFRNGGAGGGVLEHPGQFRDKEQEQSFLEAWRRGGNGLHRHRDRLLLYGVKYSPFQARNDEAQFLGTLQETAKKLARLWNMPPHLIGVLDKSPLSNIEQQSIEFVTLTIAPYVVAIEQGAARDLLIGEDFDRYFVELNVAGLLRGDFKTRWQGYAWGRQGGWLSVNDIRRFENMKPIGPAGDVYLQPLNMNPAGAGPAPDDTRQAPVAPDPDADEDDET
jgi:HK97 family phage portal protein